MTTPNYTVKLKNTVLASFIGLSLSQSCFALELLSDDILSSTTGEGVALLPQDTYMVFRGAGANELVTNILTDRSKDTGYIHYIPVGPLTAEAKAAGAGKADLYVYGLALSKSDNDSNSRLASTAAAAAIKSWGTASNPWILSVNTALNIPNFSPDTLSGNIRTPNIDKGSVSYLGFEAPLYEVGMKDPNGADAYKLKLATWVDAFQRDPSIKEAQTTAVVGKNPLDQGLIARLRLQAIWNNFGLNGSRIQLFQTLNGASSSNGLSSFYNNTLGITGVIRLNSGDASGLKLTQNKDTSSESTGTLSGWKTIHAGANSTLSTATTGDCGNTGTGAIGNGIGCQYIVQNRARTDTKTVTRTWSLPDESKNNILRLSTQETTNTDNLLTPAINGGVAPSFKADEGLFLYNPNINLVLGSLYQPLILGSDGKNFSLELARISNKESIYKQIYTDYSGTDSSYKGSTCNIYQCGNTLTLGGKDYQGSSATHSSISIGTVYSPDDGKTLVADRSVNAVGVSFGALQAVSATTSVTSAQVQYAQRGVSDQTWRQGYSCNLVWQCNTTSGHLYQWQYFNGTTWVIPSPTALPKDSDTCTYNCSKTSGTTPMYGNALNRAWSDTNLNGAVWQIGANTAVDALIGASNGKTGVNIPAANQAITPVINANTPMNNLGSAVIDGILIQHMKITTKGL